MFAINHKGILASSPTIVTRSGGIDALRAVFALWVVLFHLIPVVGAGVLFRAQEKLFSRTGKLAQMSAVTGKQDDLRHPVNSL